jgi:hypothetical protein
MGYESIGNENQWIGYRLADSLVSPLRLFLGLVLHYRVTDMGYTSVISKSDPSKIGTPMCFFKNDIIKEIIRRHQRIS